MHGLLAQVVISSLHKTNLPTSVHGQITLSVVRELHLLASVDESRLIADNNTYQLPLKGNYFPSDSHSLHGSGFSNAPTSAMDGPCSHGFARTSV